MIDWFLWSFGLLIYRLAQSKFVSFQVSTLLVLHEHAYSPTKKSRNLIKVGKELYDATYLNYIY